MSTKPDDFDVAVLFPSQFLKCEDLRGRNVTVTIDSIERESVPMSNGKTGVAGEAGDEAFMPLGRMSDGKLGVHAQGGRSTVIQMTVYAQDASSFNRSRRQIVDDLRREIG